MARVYYMDAITLAIREEMERDPRVFLMGEDVQRSIFRASGGLIDQFGPKRVRNTPISEQVLAGAGIGASMTGMRPVVDMNFASFTYLAMDQFINQLAKLHYMSAGQFAAPVTYMAVTGVLGGAGGQHGDSPFAFFTHVPGLEVVTPATPADCKGLMKAAVRSPNPTIVMHHITLSKQLDEVPEGDWVLPIGQAIVRRQGEDVTLVAVSGMLPKALAAADSLAQEGVGVEVIDPRSLAPLDRETILASVRKTGRLVVAIDEWPYGGVSAEIAALAADQAQDDLRGPVVRVTRRPVPVPFSPPLEQAMVPETAALVAAVRRTLGAA